MSLPTAAAPTEVRLAHCLLDADGRALSASRADGPFSAASTIKLQAISAVLRAPEQAQLALDAELPAPSSVTGADGEEFTLCGDHLDPTRPEPGAPIALRDLATRMIDRSSNEATHQLHELVGLDAIAATVGALGLGATRVERLIGDAAALARGLTNDHSAADLARTRHHLGAGPRPAPAPRDLALAALCAQTIPIIAAVLRDGVRWGSKSGWVDGYRHDVAYVEDPAGAGRRILAVMTAGLAEDEADARITALATELLPGLTA